MSNIASEYRTREDNNHNNYNGQEIQQFLLWFAQCLLHVVVTYFGQGLHSTPLK
jgi:hypothetical protein